MEIRRIKLKGELLLCPISDIQYQGGDFTDIKRLNKMVRWGAKQGAHFIGLGDYIDFASPSNREKLLAVTLYDSAVKTIDDAALSLTEDLFALLKTSRGMWDGLLEGHHFYETKNLGTTDQYLASLLQTEFLGTAASLIYEFPNGQECKVFTHHGKGSSIMLAGVFNTIEKLVRDHDADVYLMAHQHKLAFIRGVKLCTRVIDGKDTLQERHIIMGATGSYLKGFLQGAEVGGRPGGTYAERKMLPPLALGSGSIRVKPDGQGGLKFQTNDNPLY